MTTTPASIAGWTYAALVCMRMDCWNPPPWRRFARVHMMVEGRADDRSKKSSRCEYVIRNRPRHTATDRRRSDSARALSSPFLAPAPNLYVLQSLRKTRTDSGPIYEKKKKNI